MDLISFFFYDLKGKRNKKKKKKRRERNNSFTLTLMSPNLHQTIVITGHASVSVKAAR